MASELSNGGVFWLTCWFEERDQINRPPNKEATGVRNPFKRPLHRLINLLLHSLSGLYELDRFPSLGIREFGSLSISDFPLV